MKFLTLSLMATIQFSTSRSFATEPSRPKFSCLASNPTTRYHLGILVSDNETRVSQSSPTGRYMPLLYVTNEVAFENLNETPAFSCTQTGSDGYSITINIFKNAVQVLQQSPKARYTPVQYQITGAQG